MRAVERARSKSEMPMVVTPEEWVQMLRDQIEITWNYAHFNELLDAERVAEASAERINSTGGSLSRAQAADLVEELGDGRFLARAAAGRGARVSAHVLAEPDAVGVAFRSHLTSTSST